MNPCDYLLCGQLKDREFRTNPHTVQELQAEVEAAAEAIRGDMLRDTVDNLWFVVRI
jgi:hypothetical protein